MKWLYHKIRGFYLALADGIPLPERGVFNFSGPGVSVTDNPAQGRTDVYVSGAGNVTFAAVKAALALASSTVGLNGQKLTNLATPTTTADAATKGYVDSALQTRTITAGAGLTGGGDLSADRTINVAAGDGSIIVDTDAIRVGTISDLQHGARGGDALHALAVAGGDAGFMAGTDKQKLDGIEDGADVTDFGNVGAALAAASANVSVNNNKVTNLAAPTASSDAATKGYTDMLGTALGDETDFVTQAAGDPPTDYLLFQTRVGATIDVWIIHMGGSTVTASDTDYWSFVLFKNGSVFVTGSSTKTIGSGGVGSLAPRTPVRLYSGLNVSANDAVVLNIAAVGSPPSLGPGKVSVLFTPSP